MNEKLNKQRLTIELGIDDSLSDGEIDGDIDIDGLFDGEELGVSEGVEEGYGKIIAHGVRIFYNMSWLSCHCETIQH